jgi:hypothetical protein
VSDFIKEYFETTESGKNVPAAIKSKVMRLERERDAALEELKELARALESDHNSWKAAHARQTIHAIETGAIHES